MESAALSNIEEIVLAQANTDDQVLIALSETDFCCVAGGQVVVNTV